MASNGDGPIRLLSEGEEARLLKDIAESLNEANDVSSAMSAILPRLSQVLGLKTAWAFRYDPQRATFVEVGASGLPPALSANNAEALRSSWCECQDRMVKGHLDTAVNIVRCSRLRDAIGDKQGLKYHASIPLKMNGRPRVRKAPRKKASGQSRKLWSISGGGTSAPQRVNSTRRARRHK